MEPMNPGACWGLGIMRCGDSIWGMKSGRASLGDKVCGLAAMGGAPWIGNTGGATIGDVTGECMPPL